MQGMADPGQRKIALVALANQSANQAPEIAVAALYQSGLSANAVVAKVGVVLANWAAIDPQVTTSYLRSSTWIPVGDVNTY
jgi:hypothetical protein